MAGAADVQEQKRQGNSHRARPAATTSAFLPRDTTQLNRSVQFMTTGTDNVVRSSSGAV